MKVTVVFILTNSDLNIRIKECIGIVHFFFLFIDILINNYI